MSKIQNDFFCIHNMSSLCNLSFTRAEKYLEIACIYGYGTIVVEILKNSDINNINKCLVIAARSGWLSIVKTILKDERADPIYNKNEPFLVAHGNNHDEICGLIMKHTIKSITKYADNFINDAISENDKLNRVKHVQKLIKMK